MPKSLGPYSKLVILDPSPIARRLLWHLFSIGTRRIVEPDYHAPFEKPGAHLFWVESGEGFLENETGRFALTRGHTAWLVDMGKPRTYLPAPRRQLTITGFRFGGQGLNFWHEEIKSVKNTEFVLKDFSFVKRTYSELLRLARWKPRGWEWQVHLHITYMLGKLLMSRDLLTTAHAATLPPPVTRVLNALAANPLRNWKAKDLAPVSKVSYSVLRALFKKAGQGTLQENIHRVRLDHARLLLTDERLLIKDVAAQMNFSNEFHFSHFFHQHTQMRPTEFRRYLKE